jgi:hypothetical protein
MLRALLLAVVIAAAISTREALAQPPEFRAFLLPAANALEVGDTATIRFEVDATALRFNAYAVTIEYDPAVVEFLPPVNQGPLMTGACGNTFHITEETDSTVTYTHSILCAGQSLDGPGLLSTYRFRAVANGVSPLALVSDPDCTFADAGACVNPAHPIFPRQVVLVGAEIRVGASQAVGEEAAPARPGGMLLPASPNPFHPATTLRFALDAAGPATLRIVDVGGRVRWERAWSYLEAGRHDIGWRGVDRSGAALPNGVYLARLETAAGGTSAVKLTIAR